MAMAGATQNDCPNCGASGWHFCESPTEKTKDGPYSFLPATQSALMCGINWEMVNVGYMGAGKYVFREVDGKMYYMPTDDVKNDLSRWWSHPTSENINDHFRKNGTLFNPPVTRTIVSPSKPAPRLSDVTVSEAAVTVVQGIAEISSQSFVSAADAAAALAAQVKPAAAKKISLAEQNFARAYNPEDADRYFRNVTEWYRAGGRKWLIQTSCPTIPGFVQKWQQDLPSQKQRFQVS